MRNRYNESRRCQFHCPNRIKIYTPLTLLPKPLPPPQPRCFPHHQSCQNSESRAHSHPSDPHRYCRHQNRTHHPQSRFDRHPRRFQQFLRNFSTCSPPNLGAYTELQYRLLPPPPLRLSTSHPNPPAHPHQHLTTDSSPIKSHPNISDHWAPKQPAEYNLAQPLSPWPDPQLCSTQQAATPKTDSTSEPGTAAHRSRFSQHY